MGAEIMQESIRESDLYLGYFEKIDKTELQTKNLELYIQLNSKSIKISSYFENSIDKFSSLFEKNLETFEETLNYLEKISIPNKCVCAGLINDIPGWRCVDCSKSENTLYCNDCYVKSQDLHKGHKVYYWENSSGMCDCGDPSSLNTYCHEHSGPFNEEKDIEDYIEKSFGKKVVENLKNFFDDYFAKFSKYLILAEKCEFFISDFFEEKYGGNLSEELEKEKKDVILVKKNFSIVFKNFIYFLRLISKNNLGMIYLISNYFLKNNFISAKYEKEYQTEHRCIELDKNDIKILYDSKQNDESHLCKCPFLCLFLSNYRDNIKLISQEDEQKFIFSFAHNLELRKSFCIIYFFLYKQMIYNYNKRLLGDRTQFFLKDPFDLMTQKTNLLEDSVKTLYKLFIKLYQKFQRENLNDYDTEKAIKKISYYLTIFSSEIKYYSSMAEKIDFFKNYIDISCLFHNMYGYKSILPHPPSQEKEFFTDLIDIENILMVVPGLLNFLLDWEKIEKIKEINQYIVYKILNQEKEKIRQLKENEFSFHLNLYRFFGTFINTFCFNYSFRNNCTILESINFYKKNFFESQAQVENLVDIIIKDYCKFFGFICGCHNNFFNYYESVNSYFNHYVSLNFYQSDTNLIKYIFALTEKEININSYLKLSNIENVYTKFDKIFNHAINNEKDKENDKINIKENSKENIKENIDDVNNSMDVEHNDENREEINNESRRYTRIIPIDIYLNTLINRNSNSSISDKERDDYNIIMQWKMLLEFLFFILKDNSSCYFSLINNYERILNSKEKIKLYDGIKNNKFAFEDLKNILKEKIMLVFIQNGNLINTQKLEKNLDFYLLTLFEDNNVYDAILDELTYNKIYNETKLFYLKDEHLKSFDLNYLIHPQDKSNAEKYILDFKKDVIKIYNCHFMNHSELTFDFFHKVYEKVFLNKNNLELIIKIFENLLNNDKSAEKSDKKSLRINLLPVVLNYLQIFNLINTKSFIEFKFENKNSLDKLNILLSNFIQNNYKTNLIEKDLEKQTKEIQKQINRYKLISELYNNDLSKLNRYDYNATIIDENDLSIVKADSTIFNEKKQKLKSAKEKLKSKMKDKSKNFLQKLETDKEMVKVINDNTNEEENNKNTEDEIMCFYCRNSIKLNSFEEPYGKLGLYTTDFFYVNSVKSTIRQEFSNSNTIDENNKICSDIVDKIESKAKSRIVSCGHYFHNKCYFEGSAKVDANQFTCPLCLKDQNIIIPPLTRFHDNYEFIKSANIKDLFKEENNKKKKQQTRDKNIDLFNTTVINYLMSINLFNPDFKKSTEFIDDIFPSYKSHMNYFENIFDIKGSTFHKKQQIDNMKNLILSLRIYTNDITDFDKYEITKFIKESLLNFAKGPEDNKYMYENTDSYMYYSNMMGKIFLSLILLFDYEEFKGIYKYIIYIFLPYFCFGLYFRKLMIEKNNNILDNEQFKQKLDVIEFKKYLKDENKTIMDKLKAFLKEFCFVKIISDYQNKIEENENIINSFYQQSIKDLLSFLDLNDISNNLTKDDISIEDIINELPKTFKDSDILYELLSPVLNLENVIKSIFENVTKYNSNINYEITKELIIQFTSIRFNFIHLENNIFDFIIKNAGKKCEICRKISNSWLLCLICGKKVCDSKQEAFTHIDNCMIGNCIFVDMSNTILFYVDTKRIIMGLYPLYLDKNGSGPKRSKISNEYNLNKERLRSTLDNYISLDYHFK